MPPLLLLDLDNTLADRDAAFRAWMHAKLTRWARGDRAAEAFVVRADADGVRPRAEFLADVADRFALADPLDALLAEYRALTLAGFPPLVPAVRRALIDARAAGWRIGCVTNGEAEVQEATAARIGLTGLIDALVVSGAVGVRKPAPEIFQIAADSCAAPLAGAWMIGDGEADVLGARNAGIHSVWLNRGRTWPRTDVQPARSTAGAAEAIRAVIAEGGGRYG